MARLFFWLAWLVFLLYICNRMTPKVLLTPQFCFVGGFIPQALYAFFYVDLWDLNFSNMTMVVLLSGTGVFVFVSLCVQVVSLGMKNQNARFLPHQVDLPSTKVECDEVIAIRQWKLGALLVLQLVCSVAYISYITGQGLGRTLIESIYQVRQVNMLATSAEGVMRAPVFLRLVRAFCNYSAYVCMYCLLHGVIYHHRDNRKLLIVNITLSLLSIMLDGGRAAVVQVLFAAVVQAYYLNKRKNGWKKSVKFSTLVKLMIIGIAGVATFKMFGNFLGRGITSDFWEYLAVYLSAQLKNLDTCVRQGNFGADFANSYTLYSLRELLGRLGVEGMNMKPYLPHFSYHGHWLGNVRTAFYIYLHDGGIPAMLFYTGFMALFCQIIYQKVRFRSSKRSIDLYLITYSYFLYSITFSFFGENFYTAFLGTRFIETLLMWWLARLFLIRLHFRVSR